MNHLLQMDPYLLVLGLIGALASCVLLYLIWCDCHEDRFPGPQEDERW